MNSFKLKRLRWFWVTYTEHFSDSINDTTVCVIVPLTLAQSLNHAKNHPKLLIVDHIRYVKMSTVTKFPEKLPKLAEKIAQSGQVGLSQRKRQQNTDDVWLGEMPYVRLVFRLGG